MKKGFLIGLLSVGIVVHTGAQVKFVNEFLNIGVGARAHGMFGSVVASTGDASSAYWNTAGMTQMDAPLSLSAMHANWFGGIANYDYFTIAKRLSKEKKAYGALSFIRMGVDNIPNTLNIVNPDGSIDFDKVTEFSAADYAFLLSYARSAGQSGKWSVGGNLKVIRRVIGSFGGAWGFGADVSMQYRTDKNFSFGATIRDVTTTFNAWSFNLDKAEKEVFLKTGNDVPVSSSELTLPRLIAGISYGGMMGENVSWLAELNANVSSYGTKAGILSGRNFSLDPSFGAELGYARKAYIRMGVGNLQRVLNEVNADKRVLDFQPNVGLGIVLGRLKIDYALGNVGNVSGALASHIFSLNLDLEEKPVKN